MKIRNAVTAAAVLMAVATSAAFAQGNGNLVANYTFSAKFAQQITSYKGGYALFTSKNLISQMAESYPSISPKGAVIQVVGDTNGNTTFQVKNTNGSIVDVSSILKITPGTNQVVLSQSPYSSTGKGSESTVSTATVTYDDTSINTSNGLAYSFTSLVNVSLKSAPTKVSGQYKVDIILKQSGGVGEANSYYNSSSNGFVITSVIAQAVGSQTLTPIP